MSWLRKNRSGLKPVLSILIGGLFVVAGIFALSLFNKTSDTSAQSPQWTQNTGAGISVPACGSSTPTVTCNGGAPSVTLTWNVEGPAPDGTVCSTASVTAGVSGGAQSVIATGKPCTGGSADWSGATLFNTDYTYSINFENGGHIIHSGTFRTPGYCPPLPSPIPPPTVSCLVDPISATTGQNVTWTAVPSGGTAGAASGAISQSFESGWSPTWITSSQDQTVSARRFQASSSYWLKKVSLSLSRETTTSGRLRVTIENDSGGLPSGNAIVGGTSDLVNVSSVCIWTCLNWIDFTFPGVNLTAGTNYWIVLRGYFDVGDAFSVIHHAGPPLDSNPGSQSLIRVSTNPSVWYDKHIASSDLWYRTYAASSPPSYSYSWSGSTPLLDSQTVNPVNISYSSPGPKTGTVNVTSGGQSSGPNSCTNSVIVSASIPTVTSPTKTSITITSATLGANVTSDGGAVLTARGTCWGLTTDPTTNCLAEGGLTTGVFTHARTGMPSGTTIYYRGYATNSVGTGYSVTDSFVTIANSPPVVSVGTAHGTTVGAPHDHALSGGASATDPDGNLSGFTWSFIPPCPGGCPFLSGASGGLSGGLAPAPIIGPIYTPNAAGVHNLNLRVTDTAGAFTDRTLTETASAAPVVPTVTSPTKTSITLTGATLGANVTSNGGSALTARGTCWGLTTDPTTNCLAQGGLTTGIFTHARTGMPSDTTIYYRGYATNSVGTGYSVTDSFVTLAPTLTINLTASPPASPPSPPGIAPFTTQLIADVTSYNGNPSDAINYTFWWNCANTSNIVSTVISACGDPDGVAGNANGQKFDGVLTDPQNTSSHTYTAGGTYSAKVIVERNGAIAQERRISIIVNWPPLNISSCSASPTDPTTAQVVTWSAVVSGGDGTYTYVWSGSDGLSCTTPTCSITYGVPSPPPKTATVVVDSAGQNDTQVCDTVVVRLPRCSDGVDNDGDGKTDFVGEDRGCSSADDDDETGAPPPKFREIPP